MHELHAILDTWQQVRGGAEAGVLATVVHVSGSAYRRPGARMLIAPGGTRTGTVSGGCLEGELARKAWWFTQSGAPVVRTYDTTSDDDAVWEFGLGCNGIVKVMLERTTGAGTAEMLDFLATRRSVGEAAVVATVVHAADGAGVELGDRLLLAGERVRGGALVRTSLEPPIRALAARSGTGCCVVHFDRADVLIEWIAPPLPLYVFGAGDDAIPLVTIAKQLGWQVTVADGRPAYATRDRFPSADRVVPLGTADLLRDLAVDHRSAVVMMTHNYPLDARQLPRVLERRPRYLGLLGPRTRARKLFADAGLGIPAAVHAPAGLDVGGDTPSAVALAIVAEIQAATNRREGGMLRRRDGAIHDPVIELGTRAVPDDAAPDRPAYCETLRGSHV